MWPPGGAVHHYRHAKSIEQYAPLPKIFRQYPALVRKNRGRVCPPGEPPVSGLLIPPDPSPVARPPESLAEGQQHRGSNQLHTGRSVKASTNSANGRAQHRIFGWRPRSGVNDKTGVGSLQDRQVIEGKDLRANMPHRVSPTERIRGHIDELFAQDRPTTAVVGTPPAYNARPLPRSREASRGVQSTTARWTPREVSGSLRSPPVGRRLRPRSTSPGNGSPSQRR